jgi:hypothetical protein
MFPYLDHVQNMADSDSQPQPHPRPWMETYPGAGALLSDYIAGPWERDTQGCHETTLHLQNVNRSGSQTQTSQTLP